MLHMAALIGSHALLSYFLRYGQVIELKEQFADHNQYLLDELRKESGREII